MPENTTRCLTRAPLGGRHVLQESSIHSNSFVACGFYTDGNYNFEFICDNSADEPDAAIIHQEYGAMG
jgi:hypothetical protein